MSLSLEFETALRFITAHLPSAAATTRKPLLPHCARVGVYLYEHNYSREIVLAGLLHDVIEFGGVDEQTVRAEFGEAVAELVAACTKDDMIADPQAKTAELIKRCAAAGQDALIVKAVDILDSFKYYTRVANEPELEYCARNAKAILENLPAGCDDGIFGELREWIKV